MMAMEINSSSKYLWSTYFVPGTVGPGTYKDECD